VKLKFKHKKILPIASMRHELQSKSDSGKIILQINKKIIT